MFARNQISCGNLCIDLDEQKENESNSSHIAVDRVASLAFNFGFSPVPIWVEDYNR